MPEKLSKVSKLLLNVLKYHDKRLDKISHQLEMIVKSLELEKKSLLAS